MCESRKKRGTETSTHDKIDCTPGAVQNHLIVSDHLLVHQICQQLSHLSSCSVLVERHEDQSSRVTLTYASRRMTVLLSTSGGHTFETLLTQVTERGPISQVWHALVENLGIEIRAQGWRDRDQGPGLGMEGWESLLSGSSTHP